MHIWTAKWTSRPILRADVAARCRFCSGAPCLRAALLAALLAATACGGHAATVAAVAGHRGTSGVASVLSVAAPVECAADGSAVAAQAVAAARANSQAADGAGTPPPLLLALARS